MSSINLYKFVGDKLQINKDSNHGSTLIETLSGNFRGSVDILKPVITIQPTETSTVNKILKECNYCYIADFGRYYYVDKATGREGNNIDLELSIDVRFSWATEMLALEKGIVERNSKSWNTYLDDEELKVYNNPNIATYAFPGSFTNESYVLAVAGS